MGNENSGKISFLKRVYVLFKGRFPINEQSKEASIVKHYKKQVGLLEALLDKQSDMISNMTKQLSTQNEGTAQDKIIDAVSQYFLGKPPHENTGNHLQNGVQRALTSESGASLPQSNVNMSDDQLKEIIGNYDSKMIKGALMMGEDFLQNKIKEHYPALSDDSVLRGIEIARGML